MRLQPKSLGSSLPMLRSKGGRTTKAAPPEELEGPLGSGMQSLAAELHQSALQGVFDYPRTWLIAVRVLAGLLLVGAFVQLGLTAAAALRQPGAGFADLLSMPLLGAALGVGLAWAVSALLFNLISPLRVTPEGLGVSELFGSRKIPWAGVGILRVMEVRGGRYVVMLPFQHGTRTGTPAPALRIIPALLGTAQSGERGVLLTSDIKNFERLLQLVVAYLAEAAGQVAPSVEALIDEDVVMPVAQLLLDPAAALARLTRSRDTGVDPYGVAVDDTGPSVAWRKVMSAQLLTALGPVALLGLELLRGQAERPLVWAHLVWTAVLLALGMAELPFAGRVVQGVGDLMVGSGQYKRAVLAYLELQFPRAALIFLGAALVGAGIPAIAAQALWLAGIALTTVLTTRYVQKLYYLTLTPTLLASIGIFVFQLSLMAVYFGVR